MSEMTRERLEEIRRRVEASKFIGNQTTEALLYTYQTDARDLCTALEQAWKREAAAEAALKRKAELEIANATIRAELERIAPLLEAANGWLTAMLDECDGSPDFGAEGDWEAGIMSKRDEILVARAALPEEK